MATDDDRIGAEDILSRALDYRIGMKRAALEALHDSVRRERDRRFLEHGRISRERSRLGGDADGDDGVSGERVDDEAD